MTVLTALAVDTPQPLTKRNPEVPSALSDLVARLLAKRPEDRPPSAAAVADCLRAIVPGGPPRPRRAL